MIDDQLKIIPLFTAWLNSRFSVPYSQTTLRVYCSAVKQYIASGVSLSKIDLDTLRYILLRNDTKCTNYSTSYQALRRSAVEHWFDFLMDTGFIEQQNNPVRVLMNEQAKLNSNGRVRRGARPAKRLPVVLSWADQDKLICLWQNSVTATEIRDAMMGILLLVTGLRTHEICHLKMTQIDLSAARIRIIGKGNKERIIDFYQDKELVALAFESWMPIRSQYETIKNNNNLLITRSGKAMTTNLVYQQISSWLTKAGIQSIHKGAHVLRHTAASRMFASDVPILQIRDNLGHSSLTITQIYAHLLPRRSNYEKTRHLHCWH